MSNEETFVGAFTRFKKALWFVLNVVKNTADQKESAPFELKQSV
ncbi:MAG: hypothetical protein P8X87_02860 [Candidatus Bathyarchaeota archaeon]